VVEVTATVSEPWPRSRGTARAGFRLAGDAILRDRVPEQSTIRALLSNARQGNGSVILIEGEPGIGKSLLLQTAADEAAELGFSAMTGAADQLSQRIPFHVLRTAVPEPFAAADGGRHVDAGGTAAWWIGRLRAHLEERAAAQPVLVCLDDVHWACPATLAVLRALPHELRWQPVAWIMSRSTAGHQDTEHLFRLLHGDGANCLTLDPLGDETAVGLLTDVFGAPPDEDLLALASGATGNPALLTELAHGLADEGLVQIANGRAVLSSDRLPGRIRDLVRVRLANLSDPARHLVVTTAALGFSFRIEDAAELLNETPATLLPTLEEVIRAGIMAATDNTMSFRHQLLARAAGDLVPCPARLALDRQYGQILLGRGDSAAVAGGHLLRAARFGDHGSVTHLDTAAAQVLRLAPHTAAELALRALELTGPSDPTALSRTVAAAEALVAAGRLDQAARTARQSLARPLPPVAEARLRVALSSALCARGEVRDAAAEAKMALAQPQLPAGLRPRAVTAYLQALAVLRDETAGPIAEAILAEPGRHDDHAVVAAMVARSVLHWDGGRISDAVALLREAVRYGTGMSPDARHAQPLLTLAAALIDLRQLGEAEEILRAADHQAVRGIPARAAVALVWARLHLARGQFAEAAEAGQNALAIAEELSAHGYAAAAHNVLGLTELRRGDLAAAAGHAAARTEFVAQFPGLYARPENVLGPAQISEARDGPDDAIGHVHRIGADLPGSPGLLLGDPVSAPWLVRTALAAGDTGLAAAVDRAAGSLAERNPGYRGLRAAAMHSHGLADPDPDRLAEAAAQHLDPWCRASAAEDLGVLHVLRADQRAAIHHLVEAAQGYQGIGAAADAARVRHRLRELGVRRRHWAPSADRPVSGWESLTGAERTASQLAATGLSNRQIAGQMYVSVSTVGFYMRHIFRKLGIGSRVELARIVIEQSQPQARGPHHQND
jgi:DNA-binding CsgD family transcriptional regulator/tetratricopeptide (TPR) repeat protein